MFGKLQTPTTPREYELIERQQVRLPAISTVPWFVDTLRAETGARYVRYVAADAPAQVLAALTLASTVDASKGKLPRHTRKLGWGREGAVYRQGKETAIKLFTPDFQSSDYTHFRRRTLSKILANAALHEGMNIRPYEHETAWKITAPKVYGALVPVEPSDQAPVACAMEYVPGIHVLGHQRPLTLPSRDALSNYYETALLGVGIEKSAYGITYDNHTGNELLDYDTRRFTKFDITAQGDSLARFALGSAL